MTVFLTFVLTALLVAAVVAFWPFAAEGVDHLAGKLARGQVRRTDTGRHHHGAETVAATTLVEAHTAALDLREVAS